jgi:hypothetical protein
MCSSSVRKLCIQVQAYECELVATANSDRNSDHEATLGRLSESSMFARYKPLTLPL